MTSTPTTRDVVHAAWAGMNRHSPTPRTTPTTLLGPCARCNTPQASIPVKDCISRSFTGYDTWRSPTSSVMCHACAWCYRTPQVRQMVLLVSDDGTAQQVTRTRARDALLHGLGQHRALVLPLRGRKHLLADATWGSVSTEAGTLAWDPREAALLADAVQARAAGASGKDLQSPTPPWPLLTRQTPARRTELMELWARMEPLRRSDLRLHLASVVTSPDKPTHTHTPPTTARRSRAVA